MHMCFWQSLTILSIQMTNFRALRVDLLEYTQDVTISPGTSILVSDFTYHHCTFCGSNAKCVSPTINFELTPLLSGKVHLAIKLTVLKMYPGKHSCSNDTAKNARASVGFAPETPPRALKWAPDPTPSCLSGQRKKRGYGPDWVITMLKQFPTF